MKNALTNLPIKLVGVALLLLPFFVSPSGSSQEMQLAAPKFFAVFLLGNIAISFFFARSVHWVFGLLHAGISLLVWITGFGSMQLYPFLYWSAGALFAVWYVTLPASLDSFRESYLPKMLIIGALLSALFACSQVMGWDPIFTYTAETDQHLPISFFGQHTKFGAFIAPMAAFALAYGMVWPALVMIAAALLTQSTFTGAALFVGLSVALRWKREGGHKIAALSWVLAAGIILGFALTNPKSELLYSHGRFTVWEATFSTWKDSPYTLFGFGPGSFSRVFPPTQAHWDEMEKTGFTQIYQAQPGTIQPPSTYFHGRFMEAHNDYLQALFEGGLLALVLMLAALGALARAFYRRWWVRNEVPKSVRAAQAFLAAILVNAIGNFPFQLAPHFFIAILCFAIVLKDDRDSSTI